MIKNEIYISLNIIILHSIDSRYNPRKNIYTGSSRSYIKKKNENYNEHYLVYEPLIWDWGLSYEVRMY